MSIRTPLAKVRGHGSAGHGTEHFWWQRVTAVANLLLVGFLICLIVSLVGESYASVRASLARPVVSVLLLLLILSGVYHMRLGMQTIIEDYVHSHGLKVVALMLNLFFAATVALTCILAVLKISFGA